MPVLETKHINLQQEIAKKLGLGLGVRLGVRGWVRVRLVEAVLSQMPALYRFKQAQPGGQYVGVMCHVSVIRYVMLYVIRYVI
jgi:hypothetical protein